MLNLVRKDFIAGALFLLGVAILIPFISSIAMAAMIDDFGGISIGIFTFIVAALCVGASFVFIVIDTSFRTEMTYASLPLKRSTVVLARYVSSLIITISGFSLVLISCLAQVYIFNQTDPAFRILLSVHGITSMSSLLIIIIAIMFPFVFKYGPGKGAISALVLQITVIMIGPLFEFTRNALKDVWYFDMTFFYELLRYMLLRIAAWPEIYAYLFILSVILISIVISINLSIRFYNKRDL